MIHSYFLLYAYIFLLYAMLFFFSSFPLFCLSKMYYLVMAQFTEKYISWLFNGTYTHFIRIWLWWATERHDGKGNFIFISFIIIYFEISFEAELNKIEAIQKVEKKIIIYFLSFITNILVCQYFFFNDKIDHFTNICNHQVIFVLSFIIQNTCKYTRLILVYTCNHGYDLLHLADVIILIHFCGKYVACCSKLLIYFIKVQWKKTKKYCLRLFFPLHIV